MAVAVLAKLGYSVAALTGRPAEADYLRGLGAAWIVERGTMEGQHVQRLSEAEEVAPYFSIVVVHGQGRRP